MRLLQNSENSGILRDFSNGTKKCKNGKHLSVTFLRFLSLLEKDPKDRIALSFANASYIMQFIFAHFLSCQ